MTCSSLLMAIAWCWVHGQAVNPPDGIWSDVRSQAARRQVRVLRTEMEFVHRRIEAAGCELQWQLTLVEDDSNRDAVEKKIREIYDRRVDRLTQRLNMLENFVARLEQLAENRTRFADFQREDKPAQPKAQRHQEREK